MADDNQLIGKQSRPGFQDYPLSSENLSDGGGFVFHDTPPVGGGSGKADGSPGFTSLPGAPQPQVPTQPGQRNQVVPVSSGAQPQHLEGIVTLVQRTEEEPPMNWYRFLSKTIIAILLLPLFLTIGAVLLSLSIAFAIIGFSALSRIFNPVAWITALFEMLEVLVLGRLNRNHQQTVYRGLVQDAENRVYAFYLYGALRKGMLVEGHRVRLFGSWHRDNRSDIHERGTLFVAGGQDLTTGTTLTAPHNTWRTVFFFLLAGAIALAGAGAYHLNSLYP